jgi:hypothetical protein
LECQKNNVSKTGLFLTVCKVFNENYLNHDFQDLKD